jgi:hypothetical protein
LLDVVIDPLVRDDHPLVREDTLIYLRDCYDQTIQSQLRY